MPVRPFAFVTLVALAGCTAIKAEVNVISAEQAVTRAREANAPDLAPYEYTMAIRYLEKSKEEAGYASYKASEELARKAADWADQSIIAIEKGGKTVNLDAAGSDLSDKATAPPPVAPPGSPTAPPTTDGPIDIDDDGGSP
jgi:hypothetical protein